MAVFTRTDSAPHRLSHSASLLLDVVRFGAALAVFAGHLTFGQLHTGFQDRHMWGEYAVPVFFVLSGFVIRYITLSREHTLRIFFIDRASRIYSVVLPAMVLTLLLAAVVWRVNPAYYLQWWGGVSHQVLARILLNLTFVSQSWGHNTIFFIDAAFWSLSYECLYYVVYGLVFYMRGWPRVAAVAMWCLVAGPQVIAMLPVWWAGCWVYDLYHAVSGGAVARRVARGTMTYLALGVVLFAFGIRGALLWPFRAEKAFELWPHPLETLHIPPVRATMFAFGTGVLTAVLMLLLLFVSDRITVPKQAWWTRPVRYLANGTFTIYLMHYPLLVLAAGLGVLRVDRPWGNTAVSVVICLALIPVASAADRFKDVLRAGMRRLFPA